MKRTDMYHCAARQGIEFGTLALRSFNVCRMPVTDASENRRVIERLIRVLPHLEDYRSPYTLGRGINYWLTRASILSIFDIDGSAEAFELAHTWDPNAIATDYRMLCTLGARGGLSVTGMVQTPTSAGQVAHQVYWEIDKYDGSWGMETRLHSFPKECESYLVQMAFFRQLLECCRLQSILEIVELPARKFELRCVDPAFSYRATIAEGDRRFNPWGISVSGFSGPEELWQRLQCVLAGAFQTVNLTTLHFGIGLDDYDNCRTLMNTVSSAWEYCVLGQYRPGFDVLAPAVDFGGDEVLRCPVLYDEDGEGGPALQVDVVHTPGGAFLEFQSTKGRGFLQQIADSVEVEVEFWEAPPHLRWDGKGGAPPVPQLAN